MYRMTIGTSTFYDDTQADDISLQIVDYKLVIEDNKAGSLNLVVPPSNVNYAQFLPASIAARPVVKVYANSKVVWIGRAVSVKLDFWNRAQVFCEGAMAWLADALYEGLDRQEVYSGYDVAGTKVRGILSGYRAHIGAPYTIGYGSLTVNIPDEADWSPQTQGFDYGWAPAQPKDTSKTCLQRLQDIQKTYGGHFSIEMGTTEPELYWYADLWGWNQSGTYRQTANFGENLLDYVRSYDTEGVYTVLRPYGAVKDNTPKEEQTATPLINSVSQLADHKRFNTDGQEVTTTNQYLYVSNPFEVVKGRKYFYSGFMYGNSCLYIIEHNQTGNVYVVKSNYGGETYSTTQTKQYQKVEIPIPDPVSGWGSSDRYSIRVGFYRNTQYETENGVSFLDYSNLYYTDEYETNPDEHRLTLIDDGAPSECIEIGNLVSQYGWIERRVDFSTINHHVGLHDAVWGLINTIRANPLNLESLTVNFVDMAYLTQSDGTGTTEPLKLYDGVRVVSEPHGVDVVMYVTKIELSINPANSKITLGISKDKGISALVGG